MLLLSLSCYVMLGYVIVYYVIVYHIISYYVILCYTVSFHKFKSQKFNSSVSNPKNTYVAYLSVLSQISNCQGLGRKNKHDILKTGRIMSGYNHRTITLYDALCPDALRGSSVKIGAIQRRLAWPLRKDDTHKSRSVNR